MIRGFKQAAARTTVLSMLAASAAAGLPPAGAEAVSPAPAVLITELVPDSENIGSLDGYEYVELYNATDTALDLTGYKLRGNVKTGSGTWEGTLGHVIIPPRETVLIWTQASGISSDAALSRDQFRINYSISAADLPDERIHMLKNVSGLYNGSATQQDIEIALLDQQGTEIVTATYFLSGADDTFKNQGISFKQPSGGLAMLHNGGNKTATPGRVAADEVSGAAPGQITAAGGEQSLTLSWTPDSDPDIAGYKIYSRNGLPAATVTGATYTYTNLSNGSEYEFTVSSVYQDGQVSPASAPVKGRAGIPVIPATPAGLQALPRDGAVRLSWDSSIDAAGYHIYRDGVRLPGTITGTSYNVTGLTNGEPVTFAVYGVSSTGLVSVQPAVVTQKPQAAPSFVLTEMAPNTKNSDYKTGGTDAFEFIELYNTTGTPINLKGFKLKYSAVASEYVISEDKIVPPQGTFIIWFKNTGVQHVGLTEFNIAYGSSITEDQLFTVINGGMSNSAPRGVKFLDPDGIVLSDVAYEVADIGESITANFIPDRNNGAVSAERFSAQANPGYLYPVQYVADPADKLPPAAPAGVEITPGAGGVKAAWDPAALEPDVAYVNVYLDGVVQKKLLMPQHEAVIDGLDNGVAVSVQLSSVDTAGRESALTAPAVVTPVADAVPALLITEVVPDTWNTEPLEARDVYDAYEYIELYNAGAHAIDLKGKTVRFTQPSDSTKNWSWTIEETTILEPKGTVHVWVRPAGLQYLKKDGFNFSYYGFQEQKYVPESAILLADGAGGLNNSGGLIEIVEPGGSVLIAAEYTAGQFGEKKGITFAYPMFGGHMMRMAGVLQPTTPGMAEPAQVPRDAGEDRTPPAAPSGFQAAPGAGEATVSWQSNTDADLAGYRLYKDGQLELTLPASETSFTALSLPGEVAVKFALSAVDAAGNESPRVTASATPAYAVMTQTERPSSPANELTRERFRMAWDIQEQPGPVIPGLVQGHVPQGMSYYADDEREWILMAAYQYNGDPSTLAVVDARTGEMVKYVNLKNPDGSVYVGHAGGVAVSRENIWLSSGKRMYRLPVQKLIDAEDGGFAQFADSFGVVTNSSFAAYSDGILWVGEYSNPPSYTTPASHTLQNRSGETHLSWIAGYPLDGNDLLPANTPSFSEESMVKYVPEYVLSIGDKIQGVEFNQGEVLLTYNYGRPYNSILRFAMPDISDLSTKDTQVNIGGAVVPVWFLDSLNSTGSIMVPTSSENMFIRRENGADHLYVNFESGANHFRYMSSYSMDRLIKLNLDMARSYDTRTLTGIPQSLHAGGEAQANVQASRGYSPPEQVTGSYTWTSSDPVVAEVSAGGRIKARKPGSVVITGTSEHGQALTASLRVTASGDNNGGGSDTGSTTVGGGLAPGQPEEDKPDRQVIVPGDIKTEGGNSQLELENGKSELAIGADVLTSLKEKPLEVKKDGASLTVPAEWLKAASAALGSDGSQSQLVVQVKRAEAPKNAGGYKAVSGAFTFGLSAVKAGESEAAVKLPEQPVQIALQVDGGGDPRLLGLYAVNKDGSLAYVGGTVKDQVLTAELNELGTYVVLEYKKSYTDVPAGHWAGEALQVLAAKHVAEGVTEHTFAPEAVVTRAELTAMLVRALGLSASGAADFSDVEAGAWYSQAIGAAVEHGLVEGVAQDRFAPNEPVTREQMAVLLVRAWERKFHVIERDANAAFADSADIAGWAGEAAAKALSAGLLSGKGEGRFDPQSEATRAECAQALFNALFK